MRSAAIGLAILLTAAMLLLATRERSGTRARGPEAAPAAGGEAPTPVQQALRVRGVVLYGGVPAPGARVVLLEAPARGFWPGGLPDGRALAETRSDDLGRFDLSVPSARCAIVEAGRDGTATARRLVRAGTEEVRIELPAAARERRADAPTGAIGGTVRDARGRPVAGAAVRVGTPPRTLESTADREGRYRIDGVPAGLLQRLDVTVPGGVRQPCADLPFTPVPPDGTLSFDPVARDGFALEGGVRAPDGAAAAAAPVVLERIDRLPDRIAETATDTRGAFRFQGLVPGLYLVHVHAGGWVSKDSQPRITDPSPGDRAMVLVERSAPAPVTLVLAPTANVVGICDPLHAGEKGSLVADGITFLTLVDERGELRFEGVPASGRGDLRLGPAHAGPFPIPVGETVRIAVTPESRAAFVGVVEDPDGRPLSGAKVLAGDESEDTWRLREHAVSDGAGRFRFELDPKRVAERWAILATCPGFAPAVVRGLPHPERGATAEVRLRLGIGVRIEGTVADEAGSPVPSATVHVDTEPEGRSPWERPEFGWLLDQGPYREASWAETNEAGGFEVKGLAPGTYWLAAWVEGAKSAKIEVEAGGAPVRLVLGPRGLWIRGVVVDENDRRVRNAEVEIEANRFDVTDEHGRFGIPGVPPGPHDLRVEPSYRGAANGTPGFLGCDVRAVDAGTTDLVIRVTPGRVVAGRVVSDGGAPVPKALVLVLPPPTDDPPMTEPYTPNAITDGEGRFALRGVEAGVLEVGVFAEGLLDGRFEVQAGGEPVTLRLPRGATIDGVVLDANGVGKPAHDVTLKLAEPGRPEQLEALRRRSAFLPQFWKRTDGEGRFHFAGLPDGVYEVDAGLAIPARRVRSGESDIVLRQEPLLSVSGTVVDERGQPATHDGEGKRLKISAFSGKRIVGYIPLESDGSFRFENAPPGPIRLAVNGFPRFEGFQADVEAGSQGVRIQLQPGRFRDRAEKRD